jgi:hypothetical protein
MMGGFAVPRSSDSEQDKYVNRMKADAAKAGKPLGPMAKACCFRPSNYADLPEHRQWEIDKDLGILDWDGEWWK